VYGDNWLFCAGVDGLECLAVYTFDELVVDEPSSEVVSDELS